MATTDRYFISGGLKGRKAAMFLGGNVDDYIQVNAFAAARVAANDATGTFSAWINVPDITGTYTIIGCGDDNVVEFLDFGIEAGKLASRCTDATTGQFAVASTNVVIKPHRWHHVAAVQGADGRGVRFFVDGSEVPTTFSNTTDIDEWFVNLDGIDTGRIGASNKAGDASVTNEFKGGISNLKYWSTALTAAQVLADYQGTGTTTSMTEHWDFDEDYVSSGSDATTGTVVGDILLSNNYCEFSSRFRNMITTPVVADTVVFSASGETGYAIVIKAA